MNTDRHLPIAFLAAALLLGGSGLRAELVGLPHHAAGQAGALVVGDVKTILDGESTGSRVRRVEPARFAAALGAASLTPDPAGQGETLVLDEHCFVKSVDESTGYETTSSARGFWTGFVAGLPSNAVPTARYDVRDTTTSGTVRAYPAGGYSIEKLYRELARRHGALFAVVGTGHFSRLEVSAVKKAPCFGEPILGEKKDLYFHKPGVLEDVDALFFGLVLRSPADATSGTARIFYINPDDRGTSGILSHSHFATIRPSDGLNLNRPGTAAPHVREVAHLLSQSTLTSGTLQVYELKGVSSLPEPR